MCAYLKQKTKRMNMIVIEMHLSYTDAYFTMSGSIDFDTTLVAKVRREILYRI